MGSEVALIASVKAVALIDPVVTPAGTAVAVIGAGAAAADRQAACAVGATQARAARLRAEAAFVTDVKAVALIDSVVAPAGTAVARPVAPGAQAAAWGALAPARDAIRTRRAVRQRYAGTASRSTWSILCRCVGAKRGITVYISNAGTTLEG